MKIKIYTDGGSRGNPGEAAIGILVFSQKNNQEDKIFSHSGLVGIKTNNEAEYLAFIFSLDWVLKQNLKTPIDQITWFLDSKLVVEQLNNRWKIKDFKIKHLVSKIKPKLKQLKIPYKIVHIPREKNFLADELVNLALNSFLN